MDAIITALITGGLTFAGVLVTNIMSNRRVEIQLEKAQAVTDTKLENLTEDMKDLADEVRKHNSFGDRITLLEATAKQIQERQAQIESKMSRFEK